MIALRRRGVELAAVEDHFLGVHGRDRVAGNAKIARILDVDDDLVVRDVPHRTELLSAVGGEGLIADLDVFHGCSFSAGAL